MEVQELKVRIAPILYEIWQEAKEDYADNWNDTTFESLPEKHKLEYYRTADSILSLLDSPDSPYVLKSEVVKGLREIENRYEPCTRSHAGFHQAIQKAVELFEVKK